MVMGSIGVIMMVVVVIFVLVYMGGVVIELW
jgi:hypothetical protein